MFRIFFLLSLLLVSCSPKVDDFQKSIDDSYEVMTLRQRSILAEFYPNKESRIEEGKNYCNELKSGITKQQIHDKQSEPLLNKIQEKKITIDESVDITLVREQIQEIGVKYYCPEFEEKIPTLKEKLNSK
ncbi:hypothetical protein [Nostoc sp. UHCC 0252]|uniref:hypothetical protein n=1 Tax=Nostoc sp. UHCC 0252 TaxID=3110241 RepID=UPI002B21EC66|nr:hypothetical protein [Nostoc sp. UHCC 0252]MEA5605071.1 hypothetical protein [Nostoc sp. UHCC 0252]